MVLVEDYLDLQEEYQNKFGPKTIVLMQVGGFFELYGYPAQPDENIPFRGKVYEIQDITNLSVSVKADKYLMAGFPNHAFGKWRDILLNEGYTIIKSEQDENGVSNPNRTITEIISPGVNLDTNNYSNNIMSVYLEEIKDYKTNRPMLELGISIVDVNTGEVKIYENHSSPDDFNLCIDDILRFLQSHSPHEIILTCISEILTKQELLKQLSLSDRNIHFNFYRDEKFKYLLQPKYRTEILKKVYPKHGGLSPEQFIDLHNSSFALNSYIYLIQFIFEHNENTIHKLSKPIFWEPTKHLILSHDSITQLNIIDHKKEYEPSTLWGILNKTKTCIGKRLLRDNLLNPILSVSELNNRYELVNLLSQKDKDGEYIFNVIRNGLKSICDIERLHRKMSIKLLNPGEFINLDFSYSSILNISKYIDSLSNNIDNLIPYKLNYEQFENFIKDYKHSLKMDKIKGINLNNIKENIFNKGIYKDIDDVQEKLDGYNTKLTLISRTLSYILSQDNKQGPTHSQVDIKYNEKEGYYLSTTNSRAKELKKHLEKENSFTKKQLQILWNINKYSFTYKQTTGNTKIYSEVINNYSHGIISYQEKIKSMCLEQFSNLLSEYYEKYSGILKEICNFVGYIDFISNIAFVSKQNGYIRPKIDNTKNYSFMDAEELIHPIICKINDQVKFIPNDISLGHEQKGVLLYGVNAVGKSSLMKSSGLAIIMAQSGFYVPAKSFTFNPYKYLFTRISNNDNLRKGQSTFEVEMSELRSILIRTNKNSLVLGDELCSGTETTSGVSIVASGVLRLVERETSFIFATHLHQLSDMEEIQNCEGVNSYHMETIYDNNTKKLIYNRKLKPGSGSSIYGLEVAKAMDLDKEFIENAYKIRNKLLNKSDSIVEENTSHFNNKIVITNCSVCKNKTDDIHHISEQHLANSDGMIGDFHKNNLFNLVQLCKKCHHDVHHNNLEIKGWVKTTDGIELDYKYTDNDSLESQKKKKYTDKIDIIKDIYTKNGSKLNLTKNILYSDHKINIAHNTLKKIVSGDY